MKFGFSFGAGAVDVVRPLLTIPDDVAARLRTLIAINIVIVNDTTVDPALESPAEPAPPHQPTARDADAAKKTSPRKTPMSKDSRSGKASGPKQS